MKETRNRIREATKSTKKPRLPTFNITKNNFTEAAANSNTKPTETLLISFRRITEKILQWFFQISLHPFLS